jgi:hypothetical protein
LGTPFVRYERIISAFVPAKALRRWVHSWLFLVGMNLLEALESRVVGGDGAMGTLLLNRGVLLPADSKPGCLVS